MNRLVRIALVTLVTVTATALPASAATVPPLPTKVSSGLCHRWPRLCTSPEA